MKEKILVVEDDKDTCKLVEYNLTKYQYRVVCAADGEQALDKAHKDRPDLIILDIMLPKMDGLEVCRALKRDDRTATIPIMMVTAKAEEMDKIVGLEMGADDYLTKPFSPRELVARVGSILRRSRAPAPAQEVFHYGSLEVNFTKYAAKFKGEALDLTVKEFILFKALVDARGKALSRKDLLATVWNYARATDIDTRTVDAHVAHLRKKLRSLARFIVTVKGIGYRLDLPEPL